MRDVQTDLEYKENRKAHGDFRRARLGAIARNLKRRVSEYFGGSQAPGRIGCFDDYRKAFGELCCSVTRQTTVGVVEITGSVGRCTAFDSFYAPLCSCTSEKWVSVAKAVRAGAFLPPVKLYKIGREYFVYDGNHRISVARSRSIPAMEAVVKELFYERPESV